MNLIIGGLTINDLSTLSLSQSYTDLNAGTLLPMSDGSTVKVMPDYGEKLQTQISGSGWFPLALNSLNYGDEVVIDCIAQRGDSSSSRIITIPDVVRPDVAPEAFAEVNGETIKVNSNYAAGVLTIDETPGATKYSATWLPRLTVFLTNKEEEKDITGRTYNWSLTGVEVNAA